jgi:hypothetical protein
MLQKHILVKPTHPQDLADTPAPVIAVDIYLFLLQLGFHPVTMVGKHRIYIVTYVHFKTHYSSCCRKHSRNSADWKTIVARTSHTDASIISHDAQFKQGKRNQQVFVLCLYFYFPYTELFVRMSICFPGNFHVNGYV